MNVIIVGCGKVGQAIAAQLNEEDNNITIVDLDQDKIDYFTARYDIMGVVGNGATNKVQKEAGIEDADLLIAVTGSDELNLLCCMVAKKAGCPTIALLNNHEYTNEVACLKDELGLAMVINPEQNAAREIARILRFPLALKIETLARGRVELFKFRLPEGCPILNSSIKDVMQKFKSDVLFCTIERGNRAFIANGDFVFAEKDVVSILATQKNAMEFCRKIKYKVTSVKDAIIVGGGNITHYLCELLDGDISLKIFDKKQRVCEELSEEFKDAIVIHGDATEQELLKSEGVGKADALVALTNSDEDNILLSVYAKSMGCKKLVTKVDRGEYEVVLDQLNLDTVINPQTLAAMAVVRYVRALKNSMGSNVETLYSVIPGEVEASEFIIKANSPVAGIPLMEMKLKKNVLIAAILRNDTVIFPRGQDVLQEGDVVVVITKIIGLQDIKDVMR